MTNSQIIPYTPEYRGAVLDLTLKAWSPVFAKTRHEVPEFVYDAFYPCGWQTRQVADVGALLGRCDVGVWLLVDDQHLLGFLGLQFHPEDRMGEIHIIAVAPEHQGQGFGKRMMGFAEAQIRDAGMSMVMVETVDDSGHASARAAYEGAGYHRWPVARYFKRLQ